MGIQGPRAMSLLDESNVDAKPVSSLASMTPKQADPPEPSPHPIGSRGQTSSHDGMECRKLGTSPPTSSRLDTGWGQGKPPPPHL